MGQIRSVMDSLLKYKILFCCFFFIFVVYHALFYHNKRYPSFNPVSLFFEWPNQGMSLLEYVQQNFETFDQDDPKLIQYVRNRYLSPPSKKPYNFKNPSDPGKTENSNWIREFYKDKRNGIFIECGANEGEVHSHSLNLERDLGWNGLLIECNPTVTPYLKSKHRKAWVAGVCVSTTSHPAIFYFSNPESWSYSGRFGAAWNLPIKTNWTYFDVESVPMYSIIKAAGFTEIDYFGLDVEGAEFDILKNFPFDKILIRVIFVEVYFFSEVQKKELRHLLGTHKLHLIKTMGFDQVYIHETLMATN